MDSYNNPLVFENIEIQYSLSAIKFNLNLETLHNLLRANQIAKNNFKPVTFLVRGLPCLPIILND